MCVYIVLIIWLPGSFHLLNMVFFRLGFKDIFAEDIT
jgi:hypothetical protein